LEEQASDLGIRRADILQLTRAVVVVEGEQDKRVINFFVGKRLAEERVLLLSLSGTYNTEVLLESDFLAASGIPQLVIFDNVRPGVVRGRSLAISRSRATDEEIKVTQILARARGGLIDVIPYTDPDIIASLPESAVRAAFPKARFSGWPNLINEWHSSRRENFKSFAIRQMGLIPLSVPQFLERVLAQSQGLSPGSALTATMEELFDRVSQSKF
jgi:hypothetical protein